MSTFPGSPRVLKGAIVGIDIFNPVASVIVFQYNPDTMTRTISARTGKEKDEGARSEALRVKGAPIETIKMDVEIDATDQLEKDEGFASSLGIYPQLSALEMLLYPKSLLVTVNTVLLASANKEIVPPLAPMTLLVWGVKRVVPVNLTEFTISEEAHDVNLNPIRARCSLGLRVLSYSDLTVKDPGYYIFLAHQVVKETMATIGSFSNLNSLRNDVDFLF